MQRRVAAILAALTMLLPMSAKALASVNGQGDTIQQQGADFGVVPGTHPSAGSPTVPTWNDTFTDPTTGATGSVDIVGRQDPRSPAAGTTTIPTEVVPIDLSFAGNGGQAFNGSEVSQAVMGSPIFRPGDYSAFSDNTGVQYLDAVMRSEFDQVGSSPYHLALTPSLLPTLSLSVPQDHGQVLAYPSGIQYGCVDAYWLFDRIWEYIHTHGIQPSTLPVFVFEYTRGGIMSHGTCIPAYSGLHGAGNVGRGHGASNSETMGQTWIISTYEPTAIRPITPDHPYTYRDIDTLGHEVSEWANDPYGLNHVPGYLFPPPGTTDPGSFCDTMFETGDPANEYMLSLPGNTYFQDIPTNDGTWSLQDEVFLPWFIRQTPNTTSEPEASSGSGRYTFFGDMNPDPRFHAPAHPC